MTRAAPAWLDASAGASGDMLLGALVGAGVPLALLQRAVDAVVPGAVRLRTEAVTRRGLSATRCHVDVVEEAPPRRHYADIRSMLAEAALPAPVREAALRVFGLIAAAEGRVHGVPADEVHFHEVGALDSIADVVGVCAGLGYLGVSSWVCSPVSVGSGTVDCAHGRIPVPAPAVVELLRDAPTQAGPGHTELCTPTGAAVLRAFADGYGGQPLMAVTRVGVGAGARDPESHANALRILVGRPRDGSPSSSTEWMLETNVDDLDPRVWPHVLEKLLAAGAADAWLTPILMKKGRPAHTLHVLCPGDRFTAIREVVVSETTTIGFREHEVTKHALAREMMVVDLGGVPVAVKVARHAGRVVNAQPEYEDVALAAARTGRPLAELLQEAREAARHGLR
ncbi:nickel pincer cofactor biosynthesis protein LarC [Spirillospora sp. CA-255316]